MSDGGKGSPTPAERFAEARSILVDLRKSLEAVKRNPAAVGNEHLDAALHCRQLLRHAVSHLGAEADALKRYDQRLLLLEDAAGSPSLFRAAREARGTTRGLLISQMIGEARFLGRELTKATDEANRLRRLRQKIRAGANSRFRGSDDKSKDQP